jgi:tetratricopeptide (TPR) repeat protein
MNGRRLSVFSIRLVLCISAALLPQLAPAEQEGEFDSILKDRRKVVQQVQEFLDAGLYDNAQRLLDLGIAEHRNIYVLIVIQSQKSLDAGEYDSALKLLNLGIARNPNRDDLYALLGETLYKTNRLEEAEAALRQALRLNPLNQVAKNYIEEIRTTEQAQLSTEWQEWMGIFRDKVGDFIVTFLAFGCAFLAGSAIQPIKLRFRLHNARRLFDQGNYDEFLDLTEGLLDEERFAPLRSNFRFLLKQKEFDDAQNILSKHVNTPDRLPTLLRILERENEKLQQAS